jgi:hypothetical protein
MQGTGITKTRENKTGHHNDNLGLLLKNYGIDIRYLKLLPALRFFTTIGMN